MAKSFVIRDVGRSGDITLRQSIDFEFKFYMKQGGVPMDLTGVTFKSQVRRWPFTAGAPDLEFSFIVDVPTALVRMIASAAQTQTLMAGMLPTDKESKYFWDCILVNSLGKTRPLFNGPVNMLRRVTV
jgi:hypothetical protein